MTDVVLPDPARLLDQFTSFQEFSQRRAVYRGLLLAQDGAPPAAERQTLLELAGRLMALVEPADLFVQACQEVLEHAGAPGLEHPLQGVLASGAVGPAVAEALSGDDFIERAKSGAAGARSLFSEERGLLAGELQQLQQGRRPVRAQDQGKARVRTFDDVDGLELGAGLMLSGAGGIIATSAALAPKTAGASLVVGGLVLGGILVGGGVALIVDAVTS